MMPPVQRVTCGEDTERGLVRDATAVFWCVEHFFSTKLFHEIKLAEEYGRSATVCLFDGRFFPIFFLAF